MTKRRILAEQHITAVGQLPIFHQVQPLQDLHWTIQNIDPEFATVSALSAQG